MVCCQNKVQSLQTTRQPHHQIALPGLGIWIPGEEGPSRERRGPGSEEELGVGQVREGMEAGIRTG